jgi:3-hydroxybutyrate dehydrogenase
LEDIKNIQKEIESQYKVKTFYHGADLKVGEQVYKL